MKKFFAILFILMAVASAVSAANYPASPHKMTFNGAEVLKEERFAIDGHTYVNIRDIARIYGKFVIQTGENSLEILDSSGMEPDIEVFNYQGIPCYELRGGLEPALREMGADVGVIGWKPSYVFDDVAGEYKFAGGQSVAYYPCLIRNAVYTELAKCPYIYCVDLSGQEDAVKMYVPVEAYNKIIVPAISESFSVIGSVLVSYGGIKYELSCLTEEGEVYAPIRELAVIFGFGVDFENDTVVLKDDNISTPAGICYISGIEYVKESEVKSLLEQKNLRTSLYVPGLKGEHKYANCYLIGINEDWFTDNGRDRVSERGVLSGKAIPYINYTNDVEKANEYTELMLMYEYFVNTGIFE